MKKFLIGILIVLIITISTITGCIGGDCIKVTLLENEGYQIPKSDYLLVLLDATPGSFGKSGRATVEIFEDSESIKKVILNDNNKISLGDIEIHLSDTAQNSASFEICYK